MIRIAALAAALLTAAAGPALADGDAVKGEATMAKRCKACHEIVDGDNVVLKGGRTGPNLFGVVGKQAGAGDFSYGDSLVAAGEKGLVWDQERIAAYLEDPKAFLAAWLDDGKARSKMAFKLRSAEDRADIAAYLATLAATN